MLLGFKRHFALYVWEGSKTHTIRGFRKNEPEVGETCHCYVDPRQKTMALLGRWECVKVEPIEIEVLPAIFLKHAGPVVRIGGEALSVDEMNALAWRDGFRFHGQKGAFQEMMQFWNGRLPFEGQIIHWKYDQRTRASKLPAWMKGAAA